MTVPQSDALVFFGATGDLAHKKIFPALQSLVCRHNFDMPVVGVAKASWDLERLKARAKDSIETYGKFDPAAFAKLCQLLRYIDGDYRDPATFVQLRQALGGAHRPLHYLAIPPSMFATVAEGLAQTNCTQEARVVVEKPFGRDLASAQELNRILHRFFSEEAIFRIDHYLGKEPVQNLIYFRFANSAVDAGWNRDHIESVQITMAEDFGIKGRGKFYEEAGAIRDVVQNHMLAVVACLAMDCPLDNSHAALRDQLARALRAVRPLDPSAATRGQYDGYRQEPGVAPNSPVETFAAVRLSIDSHRWAGVPFYVRAGKRLPVTATEVLVRFKRSLKPVLDDAEPPLANYYRFRLSPEMLIALGTKIKRPGERMVGERIELVAHEQAADEMEPYERLLGDAIHGDPTLFTREDAVEASWRVVDPVLGSATPLYPYTPGTWGPAEADRVLLAGQSWYNPDGAPQAPGDSTPHTPREKGRTLHAADDEDGALHAWREEETLHGV
jgi:glucose-6-phosphate 1-dehydrogenase